MERQPDSYYEKEFDEGWILQVINGSGTNTTLWLSGPLEGESYELDYLTDLPYRLSISSHEIRLSFDSQGFPCVSWWDKQAKAVFAWFCQLKSALPVTSLGSAL